MLNKKGAATDVIVYIIVGFVFLVFIVFFMYGTNLVVDKMRDSLPAFVSPNLNQSEVTEIFNNTIGTLPSSYGVVKSILFVILVFQAISLILGGLFVRVWRGFFPMYIILAAITVVISVPISNVYHGLYNNPVFGSSFQDMVGPSWIFLHLPIWITVVSVFAGLVMFMSLPKSTTEGMGYGGAVNVI
jgi:hypothetical protein